MTEISSQHASQYLNLGQYDRAIALYEQLIETDPNHSLYYCYLGLALLLHGDEIAAQTVWLSVLAQGAEITELLEVLKIHAAQLLERQDFDRAIVLFPHILELDPQDAQTYCYWGYALSKKGEEEEAIELLQQAISLNSRLIEAYLFLGDCWREQEQFELAIAILKCALELDPNFVEAYYSLALCLREQENIEGAIAQLQKVVDLQLGTPEIHYNLGYYLKEKGEIDAAIIQFEKALSLNPDLIDATHRKAELINFKQSKYSPPNRSSYRTWDPMLFKDDGFYRLFYLTGESRVKPFWKVGEIATATSTDLQEWSYLGTALKPNSKQDWESGRILAGSVYKENGIYYYFYSAASSHSLLHEEIGLATSVDGVHWKTRSRPLFQPNPEFYGIGTIHLQGQNVKHRQWRDPYIIKDPKTELYYLFFSAASKQLEVPFNGCIGLAVSDSLEGSYEVLPPAAIPRLEGMNEGIYCELERPQVIYHNNKYHLFFSTSPRYINSKWIEKVGTDRITMSSLYWYVSDNLTDPFQPSSEKPIVKRSETTNLYATNFIKDLNNRWFAYGAYHKSATLEVSPRFLVNWEKGIPEIIYPNR